MLGSCECPECGHRTVLVGSDYTAHYCHFCKNEVTVCLCSDCGEYVSPDSMEAGFCFTCFSGRMGGD